MEEDELQDEDKGERRRGVEGKQMKYDEKKKGKGRRMGRRRRKKEKKLHENDALTPDRIKENCTATRDCRC